jgi:mRNA interferase HigB
MEVYGEAVVTRFTRKYPAARKPLQRFLRIVHQAEWQRFPAVKETFSATEYTSSTGTLIFDIGGNKYRLLARINFERRILLIDKVLTHEEYNRENL